MKIMVPTDGSERAMKAVRKSLEMAEKDGAEVTLIAVAHPFVDEAQAALDEGKALFDEKGVNVETILETDLVPANTILRVAAGGKFDMILMGSTGKTGVEKFLIGSTAEKVVANAHCSVAIIR